MASPEELNDNAEILLSIQYELGELLVSIGEVKQLNVTSGNVYAKSTLLHDNNSLSGEMMESQTKTISVKGNANPSFEETLKVSF